MACGAQETTVSSLLEATTKRLRRGSVALTRPASRRSAKTHSHKGSSANQQRSPTLSLKFGCHSLILSYGKREPFVLMSHPPIAELVTRRCLDIEQYRLVEHIYTYSEFLMIVNK